MVYEVHVCIMYINMYMKYCNESLYFIATYALLSKFLHGSLTEVQKFSYLSYYT